MLDQPGISLIVGYGSDMGNAEDAAMSFVEATEALGIAGEAIELNQIPLADLQSATISSWSPRRSATANSPTTVPCSGRRSAPRKPSGSST